MSNFVLYNYFRSSTSYRVRIALNWKNIPYEYRPVHLLNNGGEQNSPEYRKLNPIGGVPTLVHNNHIISQSRAIIEYLDEVHPTKSLLPKSAFSKAKVRQICDTINCEMHPLTNLRVMQYLEKNLSANDEGKAQWIQNWMSNGFSALERIFEQTSGKFSYGDHVTVADLFLAPQVFTAQRFKVSLHPYKNILRINDACLELKPFQKAHPYRQIDTPDDLKI